MQQNHETVVEYAKGKHAMNTSMSAIEQNLLDGPVAKKDQIPPCDRHSCENMQIEMIKDLPRIVAISIPDYACPSFCTWSQPAFGETASCLEYCADHDAALIKALQHQRKEQTSENPVMSMEEAFKQELQGTRSAWRDKTETDLILDQTPEIYAYARMREESFNFLHYNIWDWPYNFSASTIETEIIWLSFIENRQSYKDNQGNVFLESTLLKEGNTLLGTSSDIPLNRVYLRAIRTHMINPRPFYGYEDMFDIQKEDEYGNVKAFSTKLFLVEKLFSEQHEIFEDVSNLSDISIDYSCIFNAMLGDG